MHRGMGNALCFSYGKEGRFHQCGKLLKSPRILRETEIVDVHRIGQNLVKCTESKKNRQEIDFSEVLATRQTGEGGRSPEMLSERKNAVREPVLETSLAYALFPNRPKQIKALTRVSFFLSLSLFLSFSISFSEEPALVSIGTVTRKNPNVFRLLINHPVYQKDSWRILHSQINRDKPYTRIRAGTEIFLDPETREILWGKMREAPEAPKAAAKSEPAQPVKEQKYPADEKPFSERLVGAVKPLLGKPYGEINCYELLVKGLTNLGVRYEGAGGLGRKLMVMAKEQGLPMNAYFNGEGLIAASGSPVYSKTFLSVRSPESQASQLLEEIEPHLAEGQILSFSIHSRGHTGIVSRANDTWTLINSGEMDHPLRSSELSKGVGEESLEAEIRDWFKLARDRGESLRITIGRLNEHQLVT